jgi:DNA polymerase
VIVTLGRHSMERFFPGQSISRIHGQAKRVGNVYYLPLFHPAAALRRPEWQTAMEEDVQKIPVLLAELEKARARDAGKKSAADEGDDFEQLSLF